jgi:N-carbamoyl-L-amino-acid hydrolase
MRLRRDALRGAARMIEAVIAVGDATADAVATVGLVEVRPNSRNVIPGEVFFTIDYRHPDDAKIGVMEKAAREAIDRISAELKLEVKVEAIWDSPAVKFDPACIDAVEAAAQSNGFSHRRIVSGPGHDSAYIARVAPTAMIFVPCREGISHNEEESIEFDHAAAGANVLLRAVLDYDRSLEQKAG